MNKTTRYGYEQILGEDYPITNQISAGRNARATWIPPINSRNFLVMQSGVGDTGEAYISPKLTNPTSSCIHPSTHNQETFGNHLPNLRKASVIRVMSTLPNSRPSTGWRQGYLTNKCIKEIFDVGELRYSRTTMIKLWRQHLGAQLPGHCHNP